MSFARTVLLGFVAGATIVLGLPVARWRRPSERLRTLLTALATGILLFLVVDVFSAADGPVQGAVRALRHHGGVGRAALDVLLLIGGATVGLLGLAMLQRRSGRGEGADARDPRRLSLLIATGIGLHNMGEGLAIGASARQGLLGLSTVLVIGFALHNATEGFGIVSPLAGAVRPSWGYLGAVALIGGGPTTLGTVLGWSWSSPTVAIAFLSLAGGSIIFVVAQLLGVTARSSHQTTVMAGIAAGLAAGFLTDLVVSFAGG